MKSKSGNLSIFDTFKTKTLESTGEATRQRLIITTLAIYPNPTDRTRTAISQRIAKANKTVWKNIYSGIFRDLDEILLPLGLVREEGRLPLKRGPRALQEKGIPYYGLSKKGIIVAISLDKVTQKEKLLDQLASHAQKDEKELISIIKKLLKLAPTFTHSLFEKYVEAFCIGKIDDLEPFSISSLKQILDESIQSHKELLDGVLNASKTDKSEIMEFLKKLD